MGSAALRRPRLTCPNRQPLSCRDEGLGGRSRSSFRPPALFGRGRRAFFVGPLAKRLGRLADRRRRTRYSGRAGAGPIRIVAIAIRLTLEPAGSMYPCPSPCTRYCVCGLGGAGGRGKAPSSGQELVSAPGDLQICSLVATVRGSPCRHRFSSLSLVAPLAVARSPARPPPFPACRWWLSAALAISRLTM